MKRIKMLLITGMIIMLCVNFTTCDNPILEKWWVEENEEDFDYVAIIKDVPHLVYETIVEDKIIYEKIIEYIYVPEYITIEKPLPPEILMQHIDIMNIEFIIFSGDQTKYNWPSEHGTNVTVQEQTSNNHIVTEMVDNLKDNSDYFLILHGHANPVDYSQDELNDLIRISTERAVAAQDAVAMEYNHLYKGNPLTFPAVNNPPVGINIPPMPSGHELTGRITTKGYGGGKNVAGPSSTYAGLNRRVEAILFKVTTEPVTKKLIGTEK